MRSAHIAAVAAAIFSLTGCASIVKGTSQTMTIDSNVQGAEVIVGGEMVGRTPYTGPVSRGASTSVTLRKDGYQSKTVTLNSEVEPIFFGNIICGGVFGSTTDAASGAMYKYSPSTVNVDLESSSGK